MSRYRLSILKVLFILLLPLTAFSFQKELDSLEAQLENCKKSPQENCFLEINLAIGNIHFEKENYEIALEYLLPADSLLKNENNPLLYAQNLHKISSTYYKINQFELSEKYSQKALTLDLKNLSPPLLADVLRQLSSCHRSLGNFDQAYQYNMNALQVYNTLSDSTGIAQVLYSNGSLFFYQKNYAQALDVYQSAWKIATSIDDPQHIFRSLSAIGATYERLQEKELSISFNQQALALAEKMKVPTNIAYAAHNLGSNYANAKNFSKALKYFQQSLAIKKELKDEWGQIGSLGAIANLYLSMNNAQKAINYLEEALQKSIKIKSKTRQLETYQYLANAYDAAHNADQAFLYLKKYIHLQDSVFNETTAKAMGEIKNKYEFQKKENEIILLTKQTEIDSLQNYLLIGAACFLLIFSVLVLIQNQSKSKSNLELEEKNKEIQHKNQELEKSYQIQQNINVLLEEKSKKITHQNELLEKSNVKIQQQNELLEKSNVKIQQQNELLESSNEDLQQFAYVASHDLKEPLRMIGSYTSLLKRRYMNGLDADAQEFMHYIVDGVSRMDNLLTDLLSYSRANSQTIAPQPVNIQHVMTIVSNSLRAVISQKDAIIEYDYDNLPTVKGSQTHLVQLFQNLISNGLKFTQNKTPIIKIDAYQTGTQYVFSIKDNGIGIDKKNAEAIFEMFRRLHSREEYEGTGIGLATCKKIVERHGGKIWVESTPGEGSTFFFNLPMFVMEEEAVH